MLLLFADEGPLSHPLGFGGPGGKAHQLIVQLAGVAAGTQAVAATVFLPTRRGGWSVGCAAVGQVGKDGLALSSLRRLIEQGVPLRSEKRALQVLQYSSGAGAGP